MTLTEFKAALAMTRLSIDGRATLGALLVLVDGKTRIEAAQAAECSHQAVARSIAKICRATKRCGYCGAKVKRITA
ncbi:MAG: hypothetical protein AABZ67_02745 [Pseudomonadota bacterium]